MDIPEAYFVNQAALRLEIKAISRSSLCSCIEARRERIVLLHKRCLYLYFPVQELSNCRSAVLHCAQYNVLPRAKLPDRSCQTEGADLQFTAHDGNMDALRAMVQFRGVAATAGCPFSLEAGAGCERGLCAVASFDDGDTVFCTTVDAAITVDSAFQRLLTAERRGQGGQSCEQQAFTADAVASTSPHRVACRFASSGSS